MTCPIHTDILEDFRLMRAGLKPDASLMDIKTHYASLEELRRWLEDRVKEVKKHQEPLNRRLVDGLAYHGEDGFRMKGFSFFPRVKRFVNKKAAKDGVDTQMLCDALRSIGREDMVADGYSGSSLKSYICELLDNEEPIPEEIAELINVTEVVELTAQSR